MINYKVNMPREGCVLDQCSGVSLINQVNTHKKKQTMNLSSKKLQKNIHFIYKMYPTKTMVCIKHIKQKINNSNQLSFNKLSHFCVFPPVVTVLDTY